MPDGLPAWPRGLRADLAAAYVGLSESSFQRHCAVAPVQITPGVKVWLREDLDRWLDGLAGRMAGSAEVNPWHA